jgi:Flp pilus assembly pilin Flp
VRNVETFFVVNGEVEMKLNEMILSLAVQKAVRRQRGFTLLEYTMGAAVLIAIVLVGLQAFGTDLSGYFSALGGWVRAQNPGGAPVGGG